MLATNAPARPATRYHGAKWRLARWIIGHIPACHDLYCEPYGGSGAVLLNKRRSPLEVYNDLADEVVEFFEVLRARPDELTRAIYLTPFAEAELERCTEPATDPLEAARRFYVRAYLSIEGPTSQSGHHYRLQALLSRNDKGQGRMVPAATSFMGLDHLYQIAERLRGVQIWKRPALDVIARCDAPDAVIYADPPYPSSTRRVRRLGGYIHEMTDQDHRDMAGALHNCRGMVLVSGYDCELYQELFGDWRRVERRARTNGNGTRIESLWLNPAVVAALERETATQMRLF